VTAQQQLFDPRGVRQASHDPWRPGLDAASVAPDWTALVEAFASSPEGVSLQRYLGERVAQGATMYPPQPLRMLALTPLSSVKVVILGQDPYHGPGQAEGLAFSVGEGCRLPPSLRNVYRELSRDFERPAPSGGSLVPWAQQGVLLLNTCLSVEQGRPGAHCGRGWEALSAAVLTAVNRQSPACVFMLWGAHAQRFAPQVDASRHLVLVANHPSPLSATRGPLPFMGCGHFGQANRWLLAHGQASVDWFASRAETVA
jgi:uracil-DNA glycosylase